MDGYGLNTQKADIQHWAKANGYRAIAWYEDAGVSGTTDLANRPGLTEAMDAILPPPAASGLVVAPLDRLARSLPSPSGGNPGDGLGWRRQGRLSGPG